MTTDWGKLSEKLATKPKAAVFAAKANRFLMKKAEVEAGNVGSRRVGIKRLIKPENAAAVADQLPDDGERLHCLLRGDFVLCDLIPAIWERFGNLGPVKIATLGLSDKNAGTLAGMIDDGKIESLVMVVSHYFTKANAATVWRKVSEMLKGKADIVEARSHCKILILPTAAGTFTIEGSANLRSSDNLEQMTVYRDAATAGFHAGWIEDLRNGKL